MSTLLQVVLSNLVVAGFLAVVAVVVDRLGRRPALSHGLWVLVLIKLITPPLIYVPLPWPEPFAQTPAIQDPIAHLLLVNGGLALPADPEAFDGKLEPNPPAEKAEAGSADANDALANDANIQAMAYRLAEIALVLRNARNGQGAGDADSPLADPSAVDAVPAVAWREIAACLWVAGVAVWFGVAARRLRKFRRLLAHARPAAAELQAETATLAARLGLACPEVLLLPGAVSPMLWAIGRRKRLLIPESLLERLSGEQRSALLVHELAHLRRGDHWVRCLELVVLGLYWWCPLVWWARRELHEAEEACCDAWVVWALPACARAYALALVETLDFLAEARPALPPVASGIGAVQLMRRRLTMIMRGNTPRALTVTGVAMLLVVGALVPLMPTWAQTAATPVAQAPEGDAGGGRGGSGGDRGRIENERKELQRLAEDIERMRAEFERNIDQQRREIERRVKQLQEAAKRLDMQEKERADPKPKAPGGALGGFGSGGGFSGGGGLGGTGAMPGFGGFGGGAFGGQPGMKGAPFAADADRRLRELEKKLDAVLKELQDLRRDLQPRRPGFPGGGGGGGPGAPGGFPPGFPPGPGGPVAPAGGLFPPGGFPGGAVPPPGGGFPGGPGAAPPGVPGGPPGASGGRPGGPGGFIPRPNTPAAPGGTPGGGVPPGAPPAGAAPVTPPTPANPANPPGPPAVDDPNQTPKTP